VVGVEPAVEFVIERSADDLCRHIGDELVKGLLGHGGFFVRGEQLAAIACVQYLAYARTISMQPKGVKQYSA
jgi:hypothetical protein